MSVITTMNFESVLQNAVRQHINDVAGEEIERAVERFRSKLVEQKATIVMAIFSHYEIARNRDHFVITVRDTASSKGDPA